MDNLNFSQFKNFERSEFDSPDLHASGKYMNFNLVRKLQNVRNNIGKPIVVTSGFRTLQHNTDVGGVYGSDHLHGLAVDVHIADERYRYQFIKYATKEDFAHMIIYLTHVHLSVNPMHVDRKLFINAEL